MMRGFLDQDLYKFSMQWAVINKYPKQKVRYEFINRGGTKFPAGFATELERHIHPMGLIGLSPEGERFIRSACYYLPEPYIELLSSYRYNPSEVTIRQTGPRLSVTVEGNWWRVILWEVPLMYSITELYYKMMNQTSAYSHTTFSRRIKEKAEFFREEGLHVSEFGARRRFSGVIEDEAVRYLKAHAGRALNGTSNVKLAMDHDLIPIGTQAHEWYIFHAAKYGYRAANEIGMERWVDVYQGSLGIALTDTLTTPVFLRSFGAKYAKLFDGVRQDSGDPVAYVDLIVQHYEGLKIDPMTKTIVFSDGLSSFDQIRAIHKACKGRIKDAYGIGTWLSNDVGAKPLNIVIKMTACEIGGRWVSAVKLSDSPTKNTGDPKEVKLCKGILGI